MSRTGFFATLANTSTTFFECIMSLDRPAKLFTPKKVQQFIYM